MIYLVLRISNTIFPLPLIDSLRENSNAALVSNHVVNSVVVIISGLDGLFVSGLSSELEMVLDSGFGMGFEFELVDERERGNDPNKVDMERSYRVFII